MKMGKSQSSSGSSTDGRPTHASCSSEVGGSSSASSDSQTSPPTWSPPPASPPSTSPLAVIRESPSLRRSMSAPSILGRRVRENQPRRRSLPGGHRSLLSDPRNEKFQVSQPEDPAREARPEESQPEDPVPEEQREEIQADDVAVNRQSEVREVPSMPVEVHPIVCHDVTSLAGAGDSNIYQLVMTTSDIVITFSPPSVSHATSHVSFPTILSVYEQTPAQLLPATIAGIESPEESEGTSVRDMNETESQVSFLPVTVAGDVAPEAHEQTAQHKAEAGADAELPLPLVEYVTTGCQQFAESVDQTLIATVTTNADGQHTVTRPTTTSPFRTFDPQTIVAGPSGIRLGRPPPSQRGRSRYQYPHSVASRLQQYRFQRRLEPPPYPKGYMHPMASWYSQYQRFVVPGNAQQTQVPGLGTGESDDDPGYLSESSGELQNNARQVQYPEEWRDALIQEPDIDIIIDFIERSNPQTVAPTPQPAEASKEQVPLKEGDTSYTGAVESAGLTVAMVQQSEQGETEQLHQNRPVSASDDPHPVTEERHEVAKASTSQIEQPSVCTKRTSHSPKKATSDSSHQDEAAKAQTSHSEQPSESTKETSHSPKKDTPRGKKNLVRRWREQQIPQASSSSDSDTEARRQALRGHNQSFAIGRGASMEEFLVLQRGLEQYYAGVKATRGGESQSLDVDPSGEQQPEIYSQSSANIQKIELVTSEESKEEKDDSSNSTDTSHPEGTYSPKENDVASDQE